MPRWPSNEHTGRTGGNCKAHPDGVECPSCKSTKTKFRFFNNKKETQPRYQCLNSECIMKLWTEGGTTRAPYTKRSRANRVVADAAPQPPPTTEALRRSQREPKMPRPHNEHTGRTVENGKTPPDGVQCPYCKSTETKFKFFNNKKKTQPRYQCSKSECKRFWTAGGTTRAPYNTRSRPRSNPVVADAAPQPPPASAVVRRRRSQRTEMKKVEPEDLGL